MKPTKIKKSSLPAALWPALCVAALAQVPPNAHIPPEAHVPPGFYLRALQPADGTLVHQICPKVAWRSAFLCYRDVSHRTIDPDTSWAAWVLQQEAISVPVNDKPRFKTAASRELGWLPMTAGYLIFPDKSVHIVASSSSKYDEGQAICWLIDIAGKSVDIIWENFDRTTYMGPNAALLRKYKLGANFADYPPEAAPIH